MRRENPESLIEIQSKKLYKSKMGNQIDSFYKLIPKKYQEQN